MNSQKGRLQASHPATEKTLGDATGAFAVFKELLDTYRDIQRRALDLPSPYQPTTRRQELRARFPTPRWRMWMVSRGEILPGFGRRVMLGGPAKYLFDLLQYSYWRLLDYLVEFFVAQHLGARVRLMRRCIVVGDRLAHPQQDHLLSEIDRLLPLWPQRRIVGLFLTYFSPVSAIVAPIVPLIAPRVPGIGPVGISLLIAYGVLFFYLPSLAFVAKRGLMLGGSGFDAWLPVFIEGEGAYGLEARVFGVLAPPRREMPLDLILQVAVWLLVAGILLFIPIIPRVVPAFIGVVTAILLVGSFAAFRTRQRLGRW